MKMDKKNQKLVLSLLTKVYGEKKLEGLMWNFLAKEYEKVRGIMRNRPNPSNKGCGEEIIEKEGNNTKSD